MMLTNTYPVAELYSSPEISDNTLPISVHGTLDSSRLTALQHGKSSFLLQDDRAHAFF